MGVMMAVYDNAKHIDLKDVQFMEGVTEAEFFVDENDERWRRVCIDGDIVVVEKGTKITVRVCNGITLEDGSDLVIKCKC
jgi:hypothetical protein